MALCQVKEVRQRKTNIVWSYLYVESKKSSSYVESKKIKQSIREYIGDHQGQERERNGWYGQRVQTSIYKMIKF